MSVKTVEFKPFTDQKPGTYVTPAIVAALNYPAMIAIN